jgi:BCD family chlorophyll transporter-like MFS transporter
MSNRRIPTPVGLGWPGIVRLGVAQLSLGAIAVIATSTLNRIMVVELALPAIVPGVLVGLHYALQVLRPRLGHASDQGGRRTPWIIGGMALMGAGVCLVALAVSLLRTQPWPGLALAACGYAAVGVGIGGMGTALLTLLASSVTPARRPAAATIMWIMMIAGSAITAGVLGHLLQPFSFARLRMLIGAAALLTTAVTALAVLGVEQTQPTPMLSASAEPFMTALRGVWSDPRARRFAAFVFVSMLAYSGQELILEPFAGLVFGLPPGGSARIASLQHGGVIAGMLLVGLAGTAIGGRLGAMRPWTIGGCVASALALAVLALAGPIGPAFPLRPAVFVLGVANGAFAVAAIGAMMQLADHREGRAGTRMGVFGAAQAIAFACGGLIGSGASDLGRHLLGSPISAYAAVFAIEAALFLYAARLASQVFDPAPTIALSSAVLRSTP